MNRIAFVTAFLFLNCFLSQAGSFKWDSIADTVTKLIMYQDYKAADKYCCERLKKDPGDIDAQYLRLITLQSQIVDYESYALDGPRCTSRAESILVKINTLLTGVSSAERKLKLTYYKANVLGITGLLKAKGTGFFSGMKDAMDSYNILKELNSNDTSFYDALYGIGLYDYYIGDNLKWVPGLKKRSLHGLDLLYKVSDSSSPFRYGAESSLLWILIERGEYSKADSISSEVFKKFPENSVFMQIQGRAALGAGNYNKAIDLGKKLIDRSFNRDITNWTDVMSGYQLICACLIKQGKLGDAREIAKKGLACEIPPDTLKIDWVMKHRNYLMSIK